LSYFTYAQLKSSRKTFEQRVAAINANYGTEFACDPFLGCDDWGFLFDDKSRKVCYFMGAEGELLDFAYIRSWQLAREGDLGFLFLTTDKNRPVIKVRVASVEEVTIWRRRLADLFPSPAPVALAA
jgi:hypothetical protein